MSRKCTVSGKGALNGHKVSHANNKARKITYPNLHKKRLFDTETQRWVRIRVSSRVLRTIDKKGLSAALRAEGLRLQDVLASK